jgi:hypothetical protein
VCRAIPQGCDVTAAMRNCSHCAELCYFLLFVSPIEILSLWFSILNDIACALIVLPGDALRHSSMSRDYGVHGLEPVCRDEIACSNSLMLPYYRLVCEIWLLVCGCEEMTSGGHAIPRKDSSPQKFCIRWTSTMPSAWITLRT